MAEAITGVIASIITIEELLEKGVHFGSKFKTAKKDWQRYYNGLQAVKYTQEVLSKLARTTRLDEIYITHEGKKVSLLDFVNGILDVAAKEAVVLLDAYKKLSEKARGLRERFGKAVQSLKFALKTDHIQGLIQAVEQAKSSLQLAVAIVGLHLSKSQHDGIETILRDIEDQMVKQFDSLKKVDEKSRLSERNIEIRDANSTRSSGRGKRSLDSVRTARSSSGAVQAANVSVKSVSPMNLPGGSTVHVSNDNSDVEDEVASNADDDEGFAQGEETSETVEASSLHRSQEVGYGPILRCGELLAMSVDSLEDTPAVSLVRAGRAGSSSRSSAIRVDDHLEALSESDLEIRQQSGVRALVETLSNTSDTTTSCIEAEPDNGPVKSESGSLDGEAPDQRSKSPPSTELDDDQNALRLFSLAEERGYEFLNDTESLSMLVRFLKLCEKCKPRDNFLYEQATRLAQFLWKKTEITLDDTTVAWLWIFWKLRMESELKHLSNFAWKHAQRPIDQMDNEHQVYLPEEIVDGIESKRVESLARVQSLVSSHINVAQEDYTSATNGEIPGSLRIIGPSLIFGFLTLESQRWLSDVGAEPTTWEFDGVTVSNMCQAVRSMIYLMNLMVISMCPAEYMPSLRGTLAMAIAGMSSGYSDLLTAFFSGIRNEFTELVDQLENDNRGVGLA